VGLRKHALDGGADCRHQANTIERSMCGGDADFLSNYFDHLLYLLRDFPTSYYDTKGNAFPSDLLIVITFCQHKTVLNSQLLPAHPQYRTLIPCTDRAIPDLASFSFATCTPRLE